MDHSCEQCRTLVEDGVAFCPVCNAPQIRVRSENGPAAPNQDSELAPHQLASGGSHRGGEAARGAFSTDENSSGSGGSDQPLAPAPLPLATKVEWREALPGAAVAGLLIAVAWLLPLARILLWMLMAGAVAVLFYQRRRHVFLTGGLAARIGAVAGLLGFGIFGLLAAASMVGSGGRQVRQMMQQALAQAISSNADPRAQQMLQQMNSPSGIAALLAIGMVFFAVMFVVTGALGGALGAWLLGNPKQRGR